MPFVKLKDRGQMTLPQELRRQFNLSTGDVLEVRAKGATIVLTPKAIIDKQEEQAIIRLFQQVQEQERKNPTSVEEFMKEVRRLSRSLAQKAKELGLKTEEDVMEYLNDKKEKQHKEA